jgi:hypothetical protein
MIRVVMLVGVLVGSMATIGCRTDAQSCEDICVTSDDCADASHIDVCIDECMRNTDFMDDGCGASFDSMAECMSLEDHDCPDAIDSCDSEIEDFFEDCDDDFEHFEYADPFLEAVDNNPMPL